MYLAVGSPFFGGELTTPAMMTVRAPTERALCVERRGSAVRNHRLSRGRGHTVTSSTLTSCRWVFGFILNKRRNPGRTMPPLDWRQRRISKSTTTIADHAALLLGDGNSVGLSVTEQIAKRRFV
jgi:hypothetical protein